MKLRELLEYNLQSVRAYLLREDFQRFWSYRSATWASRFLREWCTRTMRSKLEPMKEVAKDVASSPRSVTKLVCGSGNDISGNCRRLQQQGETDHQKSVWLPLPSKQQKPLSIMRSENFLSQILPTDSAEEAKENGRSKKQRRPVQGCIKRWSLATKRHHPRRSAASRGVNQPRSGHGTCCTVTEAVPPHTTTVCPPCPVEIPNTMYSRS